MKVTIIGAGIGGLTTAIALKHEGIDFEIYESFSNFKNQGAGIMLANNAMQVYEKFGIADEIIKSGQVFTSLNVRNDKLELLSSMGTTAFSDKKIPSVAIDRSVLQKILLNQISATKINLGKRLSIIQQKQEYSNLTFEDGTEVKSEITIGADGINSLVRKSIFENTAIRNANQTCWRGITNFTLSPEFSTELNELWGPRKRFGFVPITKNKTYWYALESQKLLEPKSKVELLKLFQTFPAIVKEIIKSTNEEVMLQNSILDLKPIKHWYKSNICLIGDAAHATTPNMGQGACQAIEDSYALASSLAMAKSPESAFKEFQDKRQKKAIKIVNTSWSIGKMAHLKSGLSIGIRNFMLKNVPHFIIKRQNSYLFKI